MSNDPKDLDTTYCTEIESKPEGSQTLQEFLETKVTKHHYNTRRSQQLNEIDQKRHELESLKVRLKQIVTKIRNESVSHEEISKLERELNEMQGKFDDKRTKNIIQSAIQKLQEMKNTPKNDQIVPGRTTTRPLIVGKVKKVSAIRRKSLKTHHSITKLKSKASFKRKVSSQPTPKTKKIRPVFDSDGLVSLDSSEINETCVSLKQTLDGSVKLFDEVKAAPYQASTNAVLAKIQKLMESTKALLDKYEGEQKKREETREFVVKKPKESKFDPFLAPYTESLFSESLKPEPESEKPQPAYSWLCDTQIPLGQKCHVDQLFTSKNEVSMKGGETSDISFNFMPDSVQKPMDTFEFSMNGAFSFTNAENTDNDVEMKENISLDFQSNANQSNFSVMTQKNFEFDESNVSHAMNGNEQQDEEMKNDRKLTKTHLFSPLHLHYLADKLQLRPSYLKKCIYETLEEVLKVESRNPDDTIQTDDTHVSNSPPNIRTDTKTSHISDKIFEKPIFPY